MPSRFVDASVFVHAYLKPRRRLKDHEEKIKAHARAIITRINRGEAVVTSSVHLAEVANILEDRMPLEDARTIQLGLCSRETVTVLSVGRSDVIDALALGSDKGVGTSDALAAVLMQSNGLTELYSFDRDFDRIEGLRRVDR